MAHRPRYLAFFPWRCYELLLLRFKRRNCDISAPGPQTKNLRTLSFLQLLKFEKAKYPYFFNLWPRYLAFFPWRWYELLLLRFKRRNGHISAPGQKIKKLRTLSFLQLLKFEKAKYPYFFDLWPRGQDIGILSTWRYRVLLLQCKF